MSTPNTSDIMMGNNVASAATYDRRSGDRVHDAVHLAFKRFIDQPAAGEVSVISETLSDGSNKPSHLVSLSAVGMAFAHDLLLQPGELLMVQFTLFPSGRTIKADGRIVSANDAPEIGEGDKPTYRISFESMSTDDREFIQQHVDELSRHRS